jgi:hypothetical protein
MMQSQIDRMEKMMGTGDGGSIAEAVIQVLHVAANEGPPYPGGVGDFSMPGASVYGAMVVAEWPEFKDMHEGLGGVFQYPVSLGFQGAQENGRMASLNIRDIVEVNPLQGPWRGLYKDGKLFGGDENSWAPKMLRGIASGSFEKDDGTFGEIAETPVQIDVLYWSVSQVRANVFGGAVDASFLVGHMPCSSKPRAITPAEIAEFEGDRGRGRREMPNTLGEITWDFQKFSTECPINPYLLGKMLEEPQGSQNR